MPNPSGVPAFGGYVAADCGSGDADVFAWWIDGSLARLDIRVPGGFIPVPFRPDFASLFPDRVTREPEPSADWVAQTEAEREFRELHPMRFRGDLPAQPRPDDADDREYPVRGGRDD